MSTHRSPSRPPRTAILAAAGAVLILTACDAKLPTSAEVEAMDVATVEAQAERLHLIRRADGEEVVYFLNGEEISADEARAIAGDRIARLEIGRTGEDGPARIEIETRIVEMEGDAAAAILGMAGDGEPRRIRMLRRANEDGSETLTIRGPGGELSGAEFKGIVMIDGERRDARALGALHPDRIARIEVIKGDAALRLFENADAGHGVIRITTKR